MSPPFEIVRRSCYNGRGGVEIDGVRQCTDRPQIYTSMVIRTREIDIIYNITPLIKVGKILGIGLLAVGLNSTWISRMIRRTFIYILELVIVGMESRVRTKVLILFCR